eukprot:PhF_6_TR17007/c0_g1_i4/m.25760
MNFENAGKLLQVLGAMDVDEISALDGFEFGNELLANPPEQVFGIYPTTYAKDIVTFSQMVQSVFANHTRRPFVAGPASAYNVNQFQDMMSVIANSSSSSSEVLGVMTYHQYPQCMPPETNMALDPTCLQQLDLVAASTAASIPTSLRKTTQVWSGEGADHTA